ncbi:hypothetical protein B0A67_20595 [Flavobacterium aquidurense]|jgi:hypothetical protein|uniref:hypothetical protein n=1 Tax=Flavobacterium aquidurense TaxID=362413 RepID=UPI00091FF4E7|nr:hypothetical protein [Flavobacterium aquidurense]OXA68386.1 hypothetical protein B0A67_20595 [Flavobacterium aquidurense]SHH49401.1 hypothetical protein SAMN05444481_11843 [Flavobacterium frigidimaris]
MNKYLTYLISLFLAFVVIANDGTLDSYSKSASYYQSAFITIRTELDFKNSRSYFFNAVILGLKTVFLVPLIYLQLKTVFSFQVQVFLKLQTLLYQNLTSFIKQSVFVNEAITSNNCCKSLYNA